MGIYDREYYRDETSGSGWFTGASPACRTIILINVVVFVIQWASPDSGFEAALRASSDDIFHRYYIWQLLTAAFLHNTYDILHLLINMVVLWWFGRDMESMYGSREFSFMYVTAAIFSTLVWAVIEMGMGQHHTMVGASGAVYAVMVIYTLYNPRQQILLFFVLPIEMWIAMLLFLGQDLFHLLNQSRGISTGGPIAFAGHLGGAAYGYLYKTYDLRWSRLLGRRGRRPRLRVVSPEPRDRVSSLPTTAGRSASANSSRVAPPLAYPEEQLDARLDEILAKIAREGRAVLTDEENRILEEASRRYRDRRSDRV